MIVNVSTGVAHIPAIPGGSGYGTSKNAGVRFLEFVAAEEEGVRVVNVHPGVVETEMYVKSEMVLPNDDGEFCVWFFFVVVGGGLTCLCVFSQAAG